MKEYINILKNVKLFHHMGDDEIFLALNCLSTKIVTFKKNENVIQTHDEMKYLGIVLEGGVHIIKEDMNGERIILDTLSSGKMFGEALCCARVRESNVNVVCRSEAVIMMIEFDKIISVCSKTCSYHMKLIENMLYILAQKNMILQSRIEFLAKKKLRNKIISYLESFIKTQGRTNITIPFNREELADYLCVDRSALSHELARMKDEKIIDYHKNHFKLLKK